MTPPEWRLDETRDWVRRAENHLQAADLCIGLLPAEALFHCQQAAGKYLKAFLTWNQKAFRKTHELRGLGEASVQIDATIAALIEPA